MNPIYKFELTAGSTTTEVKPIYKDDLAIDYELQQGEQFHRAKLSGKLTFVRQDYDIIRNAAFDTEFDIVLSISYDRGATWAEYWRGAFWKTDCEFDEDDQRVTVTPSPRDRYDNILANIDKEYDLIKLTPEIVPVKADKRPMVQVYVPGDTVVGCFLSGMWWEQECEPVSEYDTVEIEGRTYPALTHKYFYVKNVTQIIGRVTEMATPVVPDVYTGVAPLDDTGYITDGYKLSTIPSGSRKRMAITRVSDGVVMWQSGLLADVPLPWDLWLDPVAGTGASGAMRIYISSVSVYARYITDVTEAMGLQTQPLPADDMCINNRNYRRVIGYDFPSSIRFNAELSTTPTEWGIYQPGQYFQEPYVLGVPRWYPVSRYNWGRLSIWYAPSFQEAVGEPKWRKEFTLKHAYPLYSVLSVLLGEVAPGVTHEGTTAYSEFLYGANLIGVNQTILVSPKSNIVTADYDEPAQKGKITLRQVLDMLRDCFRCYWYIDDDNRFRVEHIQYFRKGGSYDYDAETGINLTEIQVTRNGKPWAFATSKYSFDKPELAGRYQFGWMDDVTEQFEGQPIDILSGYVQKDNIEQISISSFSSDIDYIMLNPNAISKDGFVLLAAVENGGRLELPYIPWSGTSSTEVMQNGLVSFIVLQLYYNYDMPAYDYRVGEEIRRAQGIKRGKVQQVKFPCLVEPNLLKLVKTNIGDGIIQKLSVNLSSRGAQATLRYDTE